MEYDEYYGCGPCNSEREDFESYMKCKQERISHIIDSAIAGKPIEEEEEE